MFSRDVDVAEEWNRMEGWLCFLPWSCCAGRGSKSLEERERERERELRNSFNWYVVSRMTRLYRARNSFRFVPRFLIEGREGEGERLSVTGVIDRRSMESIGERIVDDLRFEKSSRIRSKPLHVDWVFTGYRRSTGDSRWKRHQAYYFLNLVSHVNSRILRYIIEILG